MKSRDKMMSTHDRFAEEKSTPYYEVMRVKRDTLVSHAKSVKESAVKN